MPLATASAAGAQAAAYAGGMEWLLSIKVKGEHEGVTVPVEAETSAEAIEIARAGLTDGRIVASIRRA